MTLTRKRVALAVALVLLVGLRAQTATSHFIWQVSNARGSVYLVGSVHVLTAAYYPLDSAFEEAYKRSDLLVEELNMDEMASAESQFRMLSKGMLPTGQSLDKVVSVDTLAAVTRTLNELGMPFEPLKQFKPWMLALTLQGMAWQKAGFDADLGLDKHFFDQAKAENKPVKGLETLEFQISRFDDMSMPLQDRLLAETLKELQSTKETFTRTADAWQRGDVPTVEHLVLEDLKSEPQMYDRLLIDRNRTWLPQIEALVARPKPAFVVVGAAHLIGPDGLLQTLKSKGYTVTQL